MLLSKEFIERAKSEIGIALNYLDSGSKLDFINDTHWDFDKTDLKDTLKLIDCLEIFDKIIDCIDTNNISENISVERVLHILKALYNSKPLVSVECTDDIEWKQSETDPRAYKHKRLKGLVKLIDEDNNVTYKHFNRYNIKCTYLYGYGNCFFECIRWYKLKDIIDEYFPVTFPYYPNPIYVFIEITGSLCKISYAVEHTNNGDKTVEINRYIKHIDNVPTEEAFVEISEQEYDELLPCEKAKIDKMSDIIDIMLGNPYGGPRIPYFDIHIEEHI